MIMQTAIKYPEWIADSAEVILWRSSERYRSEISSIDNSGERDIAAEDFAPPPRDAGHS